MLFYWCCLLFDVVLLLLDCCFIVVFLLFEHFHQRNDNETTWKVTPLCGAVVQLKTALPGGSLAKVVAFG